MDPKKLAQSLSYLQVVRTMSRHKTLQCLSYLSMPKYGCALLMLSTKLSYLERVNTKRLRSTVDSHHYVLSDAQSNVLSHSNVFNGFRIFTQFRGTRYPRAPSPHDLASNSNFNRSMTSTVLPCKAAQLSQMQGMY